MFEFEKIPHISEVSACHGAYNEANVAEKDPVSFDERQQHSKKVLPDLEEAIKRVGLKDGMTISFHHHFRNGDYVVNMVMDVIAKLGIKHLTLAASSLTDCHWPLIDHIKNGVITGISTSGLRGALADAISHGLLAEPVV